MPTTLVVLLVILLLAALPSWGYSKTWGYAPSGIIGLVLVVLFGASLLGLI